MKTAFFALLVTFIVSSSVLGLSARSRSQISIHSLHLEKISSLGSAFKGLIQLADAQEFAPVIEILTEISEELSALLQKQQQDLAVLTQQAQNDIQQVNDIIAQGNIDLQAASDELSSLQGQESSLSAAIASNQAAIQGANDNIASEQQLRAANRLSFDHQEANLQEAIQVIDEAEDIVPEIQEKDLPAGSSFIQAKSKKFVKSLALIQKKLSKSSLKLSTTGLYINQLVQIAQDVEASATINAEVIEDILDLLEAFKLAVQDEAEAVQEADDADGKRSEEAIAILNAIVQAQAVALAQNQAQLADVQAKIVATQATIDGINQLLSSSQASLESLQANFAQQSQILNKFIDGLEIDVDVVERALVFVQTEAAQIPDADQDQNGVGASVESNEATGTQTVEDESNFTPVGYLPDDLGSNQLPTTVDVPISQVTQDPTYVGGAGLNNPESTVIDDDAGVNPSPAIVDVSGDAPVNVGGDASVNTGGAASVDVGGDASVGGNGPITSPDGGDPASIPPLRPYYSDVVEQSNSDSEDEVDGDANVGDAVVQDDGEAEY